MRISNKSQLDSIRANLNLVTERLTQEQRGLATGKRINRASDDPAAAHATLRLRTEIATSEQYTRTADAGRERLTAADAALGSLGDVLQRARELTTQAGNGTLGADQLMAIGAEINQLAQAAVQLGNTNVSGQYLFAGTKTTTTPFATTGGETPMAVSYSGNTAPITHDIAPGVTIRVDVPGDNVFVPVVNTLIDIRNKIQSGDGVGAASSGLQALDTAMDTVLQVRGSIGARVNRLEALTARQEEERIGLNEVRSSLEDLDVTDAMIRVNAARNTYEAALAASARAVERSLMDFLR